MKTNKSTAVLHKPGDRPFSRTTIETDPNKLAGKPPGSVQRNQANEAMNSNQLDQRSDELVRQTTFTSKKDSQLRPGTISPKPPNQGGRLINERKSNFMALIADYNEKRLTKEKDEEAAKPASKEGKKGNEKKQMFEISDF